MTDKPTQRFKAGDQVIDRDGFAGTVCKVREWEGSVWYSIRLGGRGEPTVRYDADLRPAQ